MGIIPVHESRADRSPTSTIVETCRIGIDATLLYLMGAMARQTFGLISNLPKDVGRKNMAQVPRPTKALLSVVALIISVKVIIDFGQYSHHVVASSRTKLADELATFQLGAMTPAKEPPTSTCAYAFVIGGCNSGNSLCDGFIYNILVAAQILREEGSKHDVVALFQMSINSTSPQLSNEHTRALKKMDVRIRYIAPSPLESFFDTVRRHVSFGG